VKIEGGGRGGEEPTSLTSERRGAIMATRPNTGALGRRF